MATSTSPDPNREQLELFRALPGAMAPRDAQDLMAWPFFSLAKSRRVQPIDFQAGGVKVRVEGTIEHGLEVVEGEPELRAQVSGELWFPLRVDRRLARTIEVRRVATNRLGLVITHL